MSQAQPPNNAHRQQQMLPRHTDPSNSPRLEWVNVLPATGGPAKPILHIITSLGQFSLDGCYSEGEQGLAIESWNLQAMHTRLHVDDFLWVLTTYYNAFASDITKQMFIPALAKAWQNQSALAHQQVELMNQHAAEVRGLKERRDMAQGRYETEQRLREETDQKLQEIQGLLTNRLHAAHGGADDVNITNKTLVEKVKALVVHLLSIYDNVLAKRDELKSKARPLHSTKDEGTNTEPEERNEFVPLYFLLDLLNRRANLSRDDIKQILTEALADRQAHRTAQGLEEKQREEELESALVVWKVVTGDYYEAMEANRRNPPMSMEILEHLLVRKPLGIVMEDEVATIETGEIREEEQKELVAKINGPSAVLRRRTEVELLKENFRIEVFVYTGDDLSDATFQEPGIVIARSVQSLNDFGIVRKMATDLASGQGFQTGPIFVTVQKEYGTSGIYDPFVIVHEDAYQPWFSKFIRTARFRSVAKYAAVIRIYTVPKGDEWNAQAKQVRDFLGPPLTKFRSYRSLH